LRWGKRQGKGRKGRKRKERKGWREHPLPKINLWSRPCMSTSGFACRSHTVVLLLLLLLLLLRLSSAMTSLALSAHYPPVTSLTSNDVTSSLRPLPAGDVTRDPSGTLSLGRPEHSRHAKNSPAAYKLDFAATGACQLRLYKVLRKKSVCRMLIPLQNYKYSIILTTFN